LTEWTGPRTHKWRATNRGKPAQKIDALSKESRSEQSSLIGVPEFNVKSDFASIECF
jgi:hypothetical protein